MEIKFLDVSIKSLVNHVNLTINSKQITGIFQDNNNIIARILLNKVNYTGEVLINNENHESNLISYIQANPEFLTKTISDEFFLNQRKTSNQEEYLLKIESVLNLVGLDKNYLTRLINTLSTSEKYLLNIALNLIINPSIIIFQEPFLNLDKYYKNIIKNIILELKRKYKRTIIIISNNINILYELTDNLIIFDQEIITDKTSNIYKTIKEDSNLELPDLIKFKQIALKYNYKLNNYKDIKDLIKEVYKNVQETKKET